MKELRKDIFILIIGHGRTGTSLCTGLLNSSPNINIGYEINNQWIHSKKNIDMNSSSFLENITISNKDYNGNKIALNEESSISRIKIFHKNRFCIIHSDFKELKVIFTRRQAVNTIISKYKRVSEKRGNVLVEDIIEGHSITMKKIETLKGFFKDHYVFDFESVLEDTSRIAGLFDFIGEEFHEKYVSDYKGIMNYNHAIGVSSDNVLFGKENLFPELRKKVRKILNKKGLI